MTAGLAYATVAPALVQQVEAVLGMAKKHKYSAGQVYAAHNQVFDKKETPEVCASCVTKRTAALAKWYQGYLEYQNEQTNGAANEEGMAQTGDAIGTLQEGIAGTQESEQPGAKGINEANTIAGGLDGNVSRETQEAPAGAFTVTNKKGEAFGVTFESEDGVNGSLLLADGKAAKPGTYTTETGDSYAVQPGGKATYKNDAI